MALGNTAIQNMLTKLATYITTLVLTDGVVPSMNGTQTSLNAYKIDTAKTVTWGTAVPAGVTTSNSATSNPLNWSVPSAKQPDYLVGTNGTTILYIKPITTTLKTGTDWAYFINELKFALTEV